ncbi:glycoprotease [Pterulicium gracile]|uniref:N(6)-L-threonylcarbamoyladenine synthase n=1 Tax=Pterulicium gracile TaxID=1884261 RepID=A0A5C3QHK8_9AGAR|nr:glycoprotease [Pterula gracilis]
MRILALESSADDTCASVVCDNRRVLSNVVIKQNSVHEQHGGIHPYFAIQTHQANMPFAVQRALREADLSASELDGIAFTRGPGIGGCLSVGSNAAKSLAAALNKPLVGVHHMQAHALTPFLISPPHLAPRFPFLTLLVSGGHTLLLLAQSNISFRMLATTLDESIGRSYDKVSRLLELKWGDHGPGAALESFASQSDYESNAHESATTLPPSDTTLPEMPKPLPSRLAFSYASLHSAVERHIHAQGGIDQVDNESRRSLARAFQSAAIGQLEEKVVLALEWCNNNQISINDLVVSGGVASNMYLRSRLQQCLQRHSASENPIRLSCPPPALCTDNAAMIGWASMHRFLASDHDDYSIELRPKWDIQELAAH